MSRLFAVLFVALAAAAHVFSIVAQDKQSDSARPKTIASVTEKLQKINGFVPLYWSAEDGKMYLEIPKFNQEFLYQVSLSTGVGSNPIGLDRGQPGATKVVFFERVGNKILLVQPNYGFRALSDNQAERKAVEESFARSILWGFKIEAADGERVLVDATNFFVRDAHGVADALNDSEQGSYNLDESRSAFYLPLTKGFPKNTEIETALTLTTSGRAGNLIRQTAPTARAVTVRQRHSLVELPDANYKPRQFDPRTGALMLGFYDYAKPLGEELETRLVVRHRLEKKDQNAAVSEPIKPIVYYVDSGAPPEIREALITGAAWWNQAFEAAGFKDAFQVRVLPPGADAMDVRYNMINWVHRSTRGWAYGSTIEDPRTGEIIRGVVTLDSQRARQDFLLGSGLIPQHANVNQSKAGCDFAALPDVDYLTNADNLTDAKALALARIRQLSAHEVGHTLGFAHNFAASTFGRASVMDYPAAFVEIKNGKLDFANAYAVGIGEFDKFAVRYSYAQFTADQNEDAELEKIVQNGIANGMLFVSDADTRPASAANPLANLWDNGSNPIQNLAREMQVRRLGIEQFGINNINAKTPLSAVEAKFLPLYLHHRYQLTATAKSIGGVYYTYAVKSESGAASPQQITEIVSPDKQRAALLAVLETIKLEELAIPERILRIMPPTAYGFDYGRAENFAKRTNPIFDAVGAAGIAADLTISVLLEPNRAARLIEFNARDRSNPDFQEIVEALTNATWKQPLPTDAYKAAIQRQVQSLYVAKLMNLATAENVAAQVRAIASEELRKVSAQLQKTQTNNENAAHFHQTAEDIERFLTRPDNPRKPTTLLPTPPGDPIGAN